MVINLDDENILNVYRFGSRVYGSNTENSDSDYIIVAKEFYDSQDINKHVYTEKQFQELLNNHDIQALECYFAPSWAIPKHTKRFDFELNKSKLRVSISTIASNSWVKGKKKLIVTGDYDVNLAIKSIFHSLRIINFGIQIATEGVIFDYGAMNWLLSDLKKLAAEYQSTDLWQKIDDKYRSTYNSMSSKFKELCPKDLSEKDRSIQLDNCLKKHGISNEQLKNEILEIFQK